MDIRSFFGPSSGGGGAAKPKTPASASTKTGQGKPASPGKKKASPAAAKKASGNKGVGKNKLESNSKSKASKQTKSSPPQAANDDDGDDDDDDVVEVVPHKSSESGAGRNSNSSSGGSRRRAAKSAVNYKEDDDDEEAEQEGAGARGGNDDDDDEFEDESASTSTSTSTRNPPKKRKSASSPAPAAASKIKSKTNKKRVAVEEDEEEKEEEEGSSDDVQEVTASSSKHFSRPSSSLRSSPAKRRATAAAATATVVAAAAAVTVATVAATAAAVVLGNTSSDEADDDEDEEEEPIPTPPPKKKKPAPAGSASSAKKTTPGSSSGGGGGGFRPPWRGGSRIAPPNEGKKEVPVGKEQCLEGKTFVVSGVLDSLGREAVEDLIKQYGGKVTGSVSSRTMFLLLGSVLDDGRAPEEGSKYKKAKYFKTTIIDEDALFKMLKDSNPTGDSSPAAKGGESSASSSSAATSKPAVVNPYLPKAKKEVVNPYAPSMAAAAKKKAPGAGGVAAVVNPYGAAAGSGGKAKAAGKSPVGSAGGGGSAAVSQKPGQMWVDKYKPTSSSGVIGHGGQVKKLKVWLQNWENWHVKNIGSKPPTGKDNPGARAALLSGVPGVGKSSTATLVAREMGYHVMELNASDTRSKRSLSEELSSVIGNKVLSFGGGGGGGSKAGGFRKQLVIMDEVDGMGGSDRGGIQELILLIKKSRVPIICICNDRQHQKIRSLANHCYDLRFSRPQKVTIAKRVKAVAKMEGMDVDDNAAEMLVEANGNDIRQVLHALQMWSRKSSKLTYMNLKGGISTIEKDKNQRIGPFDAARLILGGASRTPLRDRYELFFTDYSLLPLLVHQNYLSSLMSVDVNVRTDVTAAAAAAVSDADIISGKMRGDVQHWELLPAQAALNVRVGSIGGGSLGFPEFPKWLGNYSRENKRRRLLGELSTHLNASVSGGTEAVRLSYLHFLKTVLTKPLRDEGADGAPACVALLEEYGLSRDDLFEVMPEFQLSTKGMKKPPLDVFASLDSKAKSAVTRCYNAQSHKSQALVETLQAPKRAKKRKAPPKSLSMEGEDADEEGGESSEEEDDDDDDVSVFKKKARAAPANAKKGKAAAKPRAKKTKK